MEATVMAPVRIERRTCSLTGYSGRRTTATASIASLDRPQRLRRALKGLATFWAAALGSLLIPVAHFLLVPSFFLYGAYVFSQRLVAAEIATTVRGTCPDCGKEQKLEVRSRWRVPQDVSCSYCRRSLRLASQLSQPSAD